MKRTALALATLALTSAWPLAQAHETTYKVFQQFHEPDTQPKDTLFIGTFDFDEHTGTVSNLKGRLSESMTGTTGYPGDDMTWLDLNYQLIQSERDVALGGWFVTTFLNNDTKTFFRRYVEAGGRRGFGRRLLRLPEGKRRQRLRDDLRPR